MGRAQSGAAEPPGGSPSRLTPLSLRVGDGPEPPENLPLAFNSWPASSADTACPLPAPPDRRKPDKGGQGCRVQGPGSCRPGSTVLLSSPCGSMFFPLWFRRELLELHTKAGFVSWKRYKPEMLQIFSFLCIHLKSIEATSQSDTPLQSRVTCALARRAQGRRWRGVQREGRLAKGMH